MSILEAATKQTAVKMGPVAAVRALVAYGRLVRDLSRLDEVFRIADSLDTGTVIRKVADHIRKTPSGAKALLERKRLTIDLAVLERLPQKTLGRTYADHMRQNGLVPEAIPTLDSGSELEFVRAHLYETHDVWHALTGFGADIAGELGLQAFYSAQLPGALPTVILSGGLLNTALFAPEERVARMDAIVAGWAMGKAARLIFGVAWDQHWERDIEAVRAELGVRAVGVTTVVAHAA
jgi:ubiquinone biosynthesis protein Coq4